MKTNRDGRECPPWARNHQADDPNLPAARALNVAPARLALKRRRRDPETRKWRRGSTPSRPRYRVRGFPVPRRKAGQVHRSAVEAPSRTSRPRRPPP